VGTDDDGDHADDDGQFVYADMTFIPAITSYFSQQDDNETSVAEVETTEVQPFTATPESPQRNVRAVDMTDVDKGEDLSDPSNVRAKIKRMNEKELNKLSVSDLTEMLAAFGKSYIKPKTAAVKLLQSCVAASE
jgi:hypothetical protein